MKKIHTAAAAVFAVSLIIAGIAFDLELLIPFFIAFTVVVISAAVLFFLDDKNHK